MVKEAKSTSIIKIHALSLSSLVTISFPGNYMSNFAKLSDVSSEFLEDLEINGGT